MCIRDRINYVTKVLYAEGLVALFFPIGSTHNASTEFYIDGNKMYDTDGGTNLLTGGYTDATQINYVKYWIKQ